MEQKQNAPEYGKNLGLSIFQMICCCQVTGLIALVVTLMLIVIIELAKWMIMRKR